MFATTENFLVPNGTFIVELILFLIVLGTVAKFILPPIQKALNERADQVRSALNASDEGHVEAQRLTGERREVLDQARAEARSILEEAGEQVATMLEDARTRGQTEHDRLIAEAQGRLSAERTRIQEEVVTSLGGLVIAAASRIVGQPINGESHRAIIDETLDAARSQDLSST